MTAPTRRQVLTALALATTATGLGACGGKTATTTAAADPEQPRVALMYGTTGDFSIMDSAAAGFADAQEEDSFAPLELSSPRTDDYQDRIDLAIAQGAVLAVGVGYQFSEPMRQTTDHPDTAFADVDVDPGTAIDGVTTVSFAANQSSYLVGVAAALTSATGHVGFVGGVDQPLIQNFFVGFEAGARSVDPDVVVDSTYLAPLGDFTGFSDPTKGKAAAAAMYAGGADVIYAAAGGSGQGVYEQAAASATEEAKTWAIGVDGDVHSQVDDSVKPYILTSAIKNVGVAVADVVSAHFQGSLQPGEQVYDLSNDGVGYSTSGGFVDPIAEQLEAARQSIIDGTTTVPTAL